VHSQQWHAGAGLLVFDGAATCVQHNAALGRASKRALHVVVKPRFHDQRRDECDGNDQRKSGKENPATWDAHGATIGSEPCASIFIAGIARSFRE